MELVQTIFETRRMLTQLQYEQWRQIVFSWQWWVLLLMLLGSWVVWWKLVDKRAIFEVFSFALLIVIIGTTLDTYGTKLGLWAYPIKIFYLNPGLIAGDWAMPAVVKSLVYQHFPDWKRFTLAQIGVAAFFAFGGESFLSWMGAYHMFNWSYLKSFPIYIVVAIFTKWLVDLIKRKAFPAGNWYAKY